MITDSEAHIFEALTDAKILFPITAWRVMLTFTWNSHNNNDYSDFFASRNFHLVKEEYGEKNNSNNCHLRILLTEVDWIISSTSASFTSQKHHHSFEGYK